MDNVKAKRLNSKVRNALIEKLKRNETIDTLSGIGQKNSWISGVSMTRSNADCMLFIATFLDWLKTNDLEDEVIQKFFSNRRDVDNYLNDWIAKGQGGLFEE